jgi:hypothetical protein
MPIQELSLMIPVPLLVLLTSIVPIALFYSARKIYIQKRRMNRLDGCIGCVPATITRITLDEDSWRDGWIVAADWVDARSKRAYTFCSTPQELRPEKRIGEKVLVFIDSNNPMHYSMEL